MEEIPAVSSTTGPVEKLAILGPGLLGGSIALAAQERGLAKAISLYGRSERSLEVARTSEFASSWEMTTEAAEAVWDADLVILCVPVGAMKPLVEAALPALSENAIVTDVGSVKQYVVDELAPLLAGSARFVPSHPMAGSEQTGFAAARADLFVGAMTVMTPLPESDSADVIRLGSFWAALGCRTLQLAPDAHDRLVAQISHLPHAAASALVASAEEGAFDLIGSGFLDTTRIAAGDPGMWTEIFETNRPAVLDSLKKFEGQLAELRGLLEKGDQKGLQEWLAVAKDIRSRWPGRRSG